MSKSIGNVANLLDLLDNYDPRAYRMLLLQTHYRSPVKVGQDNIDASVQALAGLDSFAARSAGQTVLSMPTPLCGLCRSWTTTWTHRTPWPISSTPCAVRIPPLMQAVPPLVL